jgi:hypothetical protein
MLPHYACVKAAGVCLDESRREAILELVEAIAATSDVRAAIFLSDLYSSTKESFKEWRGLLTALRGTPSWHDVEQAIRALPTIDGHHFRMEVLGLERSESVMRQLAMIAHMRSSFSEDLFELFDFVGLSAEEKRLYQADSELSAKLQSIAEPLFNATRAPGELSGRARLLCEEFNSSIGARYFAPERYGYSCVAHMLALEMPEKTRSEFGYRIAGGADGERNRDVRARMQARVLVPWSDTPDLPNVLAHQCVDSASSARSFFVSKGIPADVYLLRVGTMYHNVCVVFFEQDGRFTPVVFDPSPFEEAYPFIGPHKATFWRPQSISTVYSVRRGGLPFADGFFGGRGLSGLLPWSCVDIPEGRVIAFAGVRDEQCKPHLRWEGGTDEYYGRGERERSPGFLVRFIPNDAGGQTEPMSTISLVVPDGDFSIKEEQGGVSASLQERIIGVLREQAPRLRRIIERLEIPLGRVSW